jgi:hypothetical protein
MLRRLTGASSCTIALAAPSVGKSQLTPTAQIKCNFKCQVINLFGVVPPPAGQIGIYNVVFET